ncbi:MULTISPECIES: phosphoribosyl-ATP diphosphatase [unclassified Desulfurobacterium]|uniref:phosphoribosyl-ATP diphosphatase n=1 Tax=Desulfurobacterium sp. TC5-1 TaxID=1158318 RepID=UPI0003F8F297|nr:phosphoribosyl-ATP diphosphatase [Desulfurobacterium sp. TC5-1]
MRFCEVFEKLYEIIEERKRTLPEGSYTASLFKKGEDRILQKVGEEAIEAILAFKSGSRKEIVYETSDLLYHLFVAMVEKGVTLDDVAVELERRMK